MDMKKIGMSLLRPLFFVQGWLLLVGLPLATGAILNIWEGAYVALPWDLYCLYLYGKIQRTGEAHIEERFLVVSFRVSDRIHLKLLRTNAIVTLVCILAFVGHGHIKL